MARKSRRQITARNGTDLPKASASPKPALVKTGVYARLSLKDLGIENETGIPWKRRSPC